MIAIAIVVLLMALVALVRPPPPLPETFEQRASPMDELRAAMAGETFPDVASTGKVPFEDTSTFAMFFKPGAIPLLTRGGPAHGGTERTCVLNPAHAAATGLSGFVGSAGLIPAGVSTLLHMPDALPAELLSRVFRGPPRAVGDVKLIDLMPDVDTDHVYALLQRLVLISQNECAETLMATVDRLVTRNRVLEIAQQKADTRTTELQGDVDTKGATARTANKALAAVEQCYEWAMTVTAQEAQGRSARAASLRTAMADHGCSRIPPKGPAVIKDPTVALV
jgi:hypothetical protein